MRRYRRPRRWHWLLPTQIHQKKLKDGLGQHAGVRKASRSSSQASRAESGAAEAPSCSRQSTAVSRRRDARIDPARRKYRCDQPRTRSLRDYHPASGIDRPQPVYRDRSVRNHPALRPCALRTTPPPKSVVPQKRSAVLMLRGRPAAAAETFAPLQREAALDWSLGFVCGMPHAECPPPRKPLPLQRVRNCRTRVAPVFREAAEQEKKLDVRNDPPYPILPQWHSEACAGRLCVLSR